MKDWFNNLEQRERRMLIAGGIMLVILVLYLSVWEPLVTKTQVLKKTNQYNHELISWMEQSASEARELQAKIKAGGPSGRSKDQSLLGIIDRTAKTAKLGKSVKRVQPDGKTKARVWLEDVSFNDMIKWLEGLQRSEGIHIETTVIEKRDEPGLVNARLVLEGSE